MDTVQVSTELPKGLLCIAAGFRQFRTRDASGSSGKMARVRKSPISNLSHVMFRGQKYAEKVDSGFQVALPDRILANPQFVGRKAPETAVLRSHMKVSCRKKQVAAGFSSGPQAKSGIDFLEMNCLK